jgi:hypothetical protein
MNSRAVVFFAVACLAAAGCASNAVVPTELHARGAAAKRPRCHAARTIRALSRKPQEKLDGLDKVSAAITTEFKKAGVSGWKDTGCSAEAVGIAVRDAQESKKDFWTVDVELERFEIAGKTSPAGRFIRVEIWPKTRASGVVEKTRVRKGSRIDFGGSVLVDEDGPFLEVHPDADFRLATRAK